MQSLIYVLGAGSVGSTLLSMILGSHSKIVSVGELTKLDMYRALDLPCSCDEPVSKCPFWSRIDVEQGAAWPAPIRATMPLRKLIQYRTDSLRRDPYSLGVVARNLECYEQVGKLAGKNVIVDTSKDLVRLYYLYRSGRVRILPVMMVRDGRAYVESMSRRGMSPYRATLRWTRLNLLAELMIKRMRLRPYVVKLDYAELTHSPKEAMEKILRPLYLEFEDSMLNYHDGAFHNIAAQTTRFKPSPIRPMEDWRQELPLSSRIWFTALGGHYFNRRFGVGGDVSGTTG